MPIEGLLFASIDVGEFDPFYIVNSAVGSGITIKSVRKNSFALLTLTKLLSSICGTCKQLFEIGDVLLT